MNKSILINLKENSLAGINVEFIDEPPSNPPKHSVFLDKDSGKRYKWINEAWVEVVDSDES